MGISPTAGAAFHTGRAVAISGNDVVVACCELVALAQHLGRRDETQ